MAITKLQQEMDEILQELVEDAMSNASWVNLGGEWDASEYSDRLYKLVTESK